MALSHSIAIYLNFGSIYGKIRICKELKTELS